MIEKLNLEEIFDQSQRGTVREIIEKINEIIDELEKPVEVVEKVVEKEVVE